MSHDHLTALDATFLELEQIDDSAHMHIGAIMVFDPTPQRTPPSREELALVLDERLGVLPRYRQRLSSRHTGGLSWPAWEDDPAFDPLHHVRREALPAPGDRARLEACSGEFFSQRLDRSRPLWEFVILEGLEGGRWALASKTHHCMVDGVGSVDVGHVILDTEAEPAPWKPPAEPIAPSGGPGLLGGVVETAKGGLNAALHPRETLRRTRAAAEMLVRDEVVAAPSCSLNATIGAHRRFAVIDAELSEIKAIKRALGGTVNDVALTVVTSGLRALLLARGEDPPRDGLRAMVPVNLRQDAEHLALGNKVSSLFPRLPVAEPDLGRRYDAVRAESTAQKRSTSARARAPSSG